MVSARSYIQLKLCLLLLLLGTATSQTSTDSTTTDSSTVAPGTTPADISGTPEIDTTTEGPTICQNYNFLCNLNDVPMIALLVAPGVGLVLLTVLLAVACSLCRRRDEDDEDYLERGRGASEMAMNDYRSNMAASSIHGGDDFSRQHKTNPAYVDDEDAAVPPFRHPSVSGSERMDNRRPQQMGYGDREDQRRPTSYYPDDDMRHPPGADPRARPAQYGDDPRRGGSRYMEEDPRRPPPDSRGRPYGHPADRDDGRRPTSSGSMYDKHDPRAGPRPQPRESVAAGKRNWAKQSAMPQDVPPADYGDGFPNPRASYAGGLRQNPNSYY